MAKTKIEWADRVWNPITGCSKISPGCANCYAERMAKRLAGRCGYPKRNPFRVTLHLNKIDEPLRWTKPAKIFVCSMGDLFHDDVPDDWICNILGRILLAKQHTFMILTKRADRMTKFFSDWEFENSPIPNLWLGVTAENQEQADKRIPVLLQIPAAKRFVSVEPILGPVDLQSGVLGDTLCRCGGCLDYAKENPDRWQAQRIDWVICGGESGPGARPIHPDWARSLRDQCRAAGVPFFFKQWGEWQQIGVCGNSADDGKYYHTDNIERINHDGGRGYHGSGAIYMQRVGKKEAGRLLDGREWNEMPDSKQLTAG